ncbi:MAG: acyltransferase [Flavobacteriales bacterium]|nr:acyltransferase [Flavobacteriales bacterium]
MKELKENTIWINYLRTAITILVVFHHSNLAYTTFAYFNNEVYINSTHPIIDSKRWLGLDILVNFNDIYFMSLMFSIGGLFLIKSINRKGQKQFIFDRIKRLFIPFLFLGTLFMLVAYLPSYNISNGNWNLQTYIVDFFTTQNWPVGPPWFIWLLFAFNMLFAITYKPLSNLYLKVGSNINKYGKQPYIIILGFLIVTSLLYIPISYKLGANAWTGFGPFDFQLNRIFLYAGFFWIGVFMGSVDFNNSFLSYKSELVKLWKIYWIIALAIFIILTLIPPYLTNLVIRHGVDEFYTWIIYYFIYTLSICFTSLAMTTSFKTSIKSENLVWNRLTENAYMIYLCHYPIVVWTQYFLLDFELHSSIKATITFVAGISLSWILSTQLRKIKVIRRFI